MNLGGVTAVCSKAMYLTPLKSRDSDEEIVHVSRKLNDQKEGTCQVTFLKGNIVEGITKYKGLNIRAGCVIGQ